MALKSDYGLFLRWGKIFTSDPEVIAIVADIILLWPSFKYLTAWEGHWEES